MMFTGKIAVMTGHFFECCLRALQQDEPEVEPWECPYCHTVGKLEDGLWERDLEASLANMKKHPLDIRQAFGLTNDKE